MKNKGRWSKGKNGQEIGSPALESLRINHMRWQMEDCIRDMKTVFKSRPAYLSKENRIQAVIFWGRSFHEARGGCIIPLKAIGEGVI